jgi:hypothetical protein
MSELKHTPGPWIYDPNDRDDLQVKNEKGNRLADVIDNRAFTLNQCQANAKLIAAAPDMIKAIIDAIEFITISYNCRNNSMATEMIQKLQSIIDEAT